ncbi:ATP-binding protein [Streptacidiphilus pinicola]|uniref:ATP-binding protein n=1 Tax=Streptacidiphilus pinicola TaxID=2219663 RepID=A0A2X0JA12_9ACTN|nr:AAA family ATPase [Streptacidiphilus pinicola]RAG87136.1 ATP-binding protein [Streptacidiphilus pinicola]
MQGLLEREHELDAVRAAVTTLREERAGALVVVTGAAGLGKTSVLAAARDAAADEELLVLSSRGGEQEQGSAFTVARGLLGPLLESVGEEERQALLGGWNAIVGSALGVAPSAGAAPDPQGVRDGLDWVVTNLAFARGPLVLVVDDAHWADAESLAWLAGFAGRVADLPVLLVVAYRPDELPDWADAFRGMAGDNGVTPLGLSALTPEAVDALVRALYHAPDAESAAARAADLAAGLAADPATGSEAARASGLTAEGAAAAAPAPGADRRAGSSADHARDAEGAAGEEEAWDFAQDADAMGAFAREVWALTGGNPFETVQLVALARERGIMPGEDSWIRLRELAAENTGSGLIARLRRLGSGPVRLARAVAVLGIATPVEQAAQVAGLGPAEADAAAERLRHERVLTGRQILEFVHPLIATSVYRSIPEQERTDLHARSAHAVLESGRSPMVAARHWLEVPPGGNPRVVDQLRVAAQLFMQSGAPETAQRCLARAVDEPPPVAERAQVLFELGCSTLLYDPAATAEQLRTALRQPVIPASLREEISVRLAQSLAHSNNLAEAAETMAEEVLRADDEGVRLKMQVWQFMWGAFDAFEQGSEERSKRLADLAERLDVEGDRSIAARYVLGLRAWDATVRGEPVDLALHYSDRALEGELRWAHPEWGFEVPVLVALTYMYGDRPERALELFAQGIEEYERAGWRGAHLSFGHTILGYVHYRTGDLAEAEKEARYGLELANRVGEGTPVHWYAVGTLIAVLAARGATEEARSLADRYRFRAPYSNAVVFPDAQTVRGVLLLELGEFVDAEAELTQAGTRLDARGMRNPGWCGWQRSLLAACAGLGDLDRARELAVDQLERAERYGTLSAIGTALRAAADVAPDPQARLDRLRLAVQLLERAHAPYERARALHQLALSLAGTGGDATPAFRAAAEAADSCSADALARTARSHLDA